VKRDDAGLYWALEEELKPLPTRGDWGFERSSDSITPAARPTSGWL
jgi:hypothetical protein